MGESTETLIRTVQQGFVGLVPLDVVAVQERLGPRVAPDDRGQLPREVEGVGHAVIHALATDGHMHVPGVARQEHPAFTEPSCQPVLGAETRDPTRFAQFQAGVAGHLPGDVLDFAEGGFVVGVGMLIGLHAKHPMVPLGVEGQKHQRAFGFDETVARAVGVGPVRLRIGHEELDPRITGAIEGDSHRVAGLARRPLAIYEPSGPRRARPVVLGQMAQGDADPVRVLGKRRGLDPSFHHDGHPLQMFGQQPFSRLLADGDGM